jgi:poly-gamma-glutamate synthesis protein (capsule biosynthesis protein)
MVREKISKLKRQKKLAFALIIFTFLISVFSYVTFKVIYTAKNKIVSYKTSIQPKNNEVNKKYIAPKKNSSQTEVLLSSAGDCTIGTDPSFDESTSLPTIVEDHNDDYSYLFKNALPIFEKDDITTVNLETTFTNATVSADKTFTFKAPPEFCKALTLGSIEGVNISNNHIHDFLDKGFNDTLSTLKQNKINYFGEGNIWVKEIKGVKFGFLGYTGWNYDNELKNKLKKDIAQLKAKNCVVVINFHWGQEGNYYPNSTQKNIAHYAIDQGADLIIGHHPHVIEGIEKYKGKIICYSLGNFCFGGNSNPKDKDTFVLQAKFSFNDNRLTKYNVKAIPFSISSVSYRNNYCPTPLEGRAKENLLKKINTLSSNLGFQVSDSFN